MADVCKEDNEELSYPKQAANSEARRHENMLAYTDSQCWRQINKNQNTIWRGKMSK